MGVPSLTPERAGQRAAAALPAQATAGLGGISCSCVHSGNSAVSLASPPVLSSVAGLVTRWRAGGGWQLHGGFFAHGHEIPSSSDPISFWFRCLMLSAALGEQTG